MEAVIVALIVAGGGIIGQWVLRRQEFKRQDEVASRLLAANERAAVTATVTNGKLDVIHKIVNGNMTAAMRGELDATILALALMREMVDLRRAAGEEPSTETLATIKATAKRIVELSAAFDDRLRATETETGE